MDDPGSLVPEAGPPLVVDIDGTLTDADRRLDPRVFPVLRSWPAPVVVATGKALPFPVALCGFMGIDVLVIAENGGVVVSGPTDTLHVAGDRAAASAVATAYRERGYELGWGGIDLANRWRETEIIVSRDAPLDPLAELAADHGLTVVDTGFAYHVKSTDFDKGTGLEFIGRELDRAPGSFAAVGDSVNDVPVFDLVGDAVAVANADDAARRAADHVTAAEYAEGFLEGLEWIARTVEV